MRKSAPLLYAIIFDNEHGVRFDDVLIVSVELRYMNQG